MVMEETATEVAEASENGTLALDKEEKIEVKEMEEESKVNEKADTVKMDVDPELKETQQEEVKKEDETVKIEDENEVKEEVKEEKGSPGTTKRRKRRSFGVKEEVDEKKVNEPITPVAYTFDRPVRERKTVERLVAYIDKEAVKEFHVEKGRGTRLKDIPNVAYKLSRRKNDDSFKLLHTILFGRRGKAFHIKNNISQYSGFVWHDNEEKQKLKMKEKFDKCVKEKLLDFCDVFDLPVSKATTRKEDIVMKLIDFLAAPHATTDVLLAEKEQSSKARKRKRVVKRSASRSGGTSAKRSKRKNSEGTPEEKVKKGAPETEDKSEEEENENGVSDESEDDVPEHSESEEREKEEEKKKEDESEEETEEDTGKHKHVPKKSLTKKESVGKSKIKTLTIPKKDTPAASPGKPPSESSSKRSKVDSSCDATPRVFSRKKKNEEATSKKSTLVKIPIKEKAAKEKIGKKVRKGKEKSEEKSGPSEEDLRNATCEILKEVDVNTATFSDILKKLTQHFGMDLTPQKSSIKSMIQEELNKLADEVEENEDDEDEEDTEKEDAQPAGKEVEA